MRQIPVAKRVKVSVVLAAKVEALNGVTRLETLWLYQLKATT
jgi:hypothetical protein